MVQDKKHAEKKGWCEMKAVSREQAVAVMAVLMSNIDWDELDGELLQKEVVTKPKEAGKRCTQFLKNGAMAVICSAGSFVLKLVDAFNHTEFLGRDWKVTERDEREDSLTEVDWSKVDYETCLKDGEPLIAGEEKLKRLKAGFKIRHGGRAFLSLWKDYQEKGETSVLEKLYKAKGITYVDFFGLVLQTPGGYRRVLYLYRYAGGGWYWFCGWLDRDWDAGNFSAVSQVSSS
jgi:hypothetical protein